MSAPEGPPEDRHDAGFLEGAGSLPELFRRVAERRPDHTALVDDGRAIDYASLDEASDRLAARLARQGTRPGGLIGLLTERGAGIPVGILGILKSGSGYVPLDPGYPPQRLRHMVDDARVDAIVGDPDVARELGLTGVPVVPLYVPDAGAPDPPAPVISGSDPAYVIYTSGSTGTPKGCVVTHDNVLSLLRAALPLFDVTAADRWALFHSASFDVSVWEFWAAMATGATAVTVSEATVRSPIDFVTQLRRDRITVLGQVPSVFRSLALAYADAGRPDLFLRYLVFAGERADLDVIRDFLGGVRGTRPVAVNMYGPTETTVYATHRVLTPADLDGDVPAPIGTPLPNAEIRILGDGMDLVPDGDSGEMWIGGECVSQGYLHRPELTAERFVVLDGPEGPRRFYRSGDLARWLDDGSLEFLGRNDLQIKVRGHRIEPAEIEVALRAHRDVRDAAVAVVTTAVGAQFLTAYLVPAESATAELAGSVRRHVAAVLPRYMVPDRYTTVAELPLSSSGKLDRAMLPRLAPSGPRK